MREFITEVKSKINLMPENGFDEAEDKALIVELIDRAETGRLLEDITEVAKNIRGIMKYYGIIINQ